MIDITAVNNQLVGQDEALRATFARASSTVVDDPAMRALIEMLAAGLAAIHERQGNLITLMLQTNN